MATEATPPPYDATTPNNMTINGSAPGAVHPFPKQPNPATQYQPPPLQFSQPQYQPSQPPPSSQYQPFQPPPSSQYQPFQPPPSSQYQPFQPPPSSQYQPSQPPSSQYQPSQPPSSQYQPFPPHPSQPFQSQYQRPPPQHVQQTTSNVTVVNSQPTVVSGYSYGPKPESYMILSILTCLFCCWLFGLIAIMYSAQVNPAWRAGNYDAARRAAQTALYWNIATIISGIVIGVVGGTSYGVTS